MRPRPSYELEVDLPPEVVLQRVREALGDGACPCTGHVGRRHLNLHICEQERHFWSPWISIEVIPSGEGSRLRGAFGPHPRAWTLFVALYAVLVFAFVGGSMWGFVQALLDGDRVGWVIAGSALVGLALACAANIAGEWAGADQMAITRGFVASALGVPDPELSGETGGRASG